MDGPGHIRPFSPELRYVRMRKLLILGICCMAIGRNEECQMGIGFLLTRSGVGSRVKSFSFELGTRTRTANK